MDQGDKDNDENEESDSPERCSVALEVKSEVYEASIPGRRNAGKGFALAR